MPRRLEQFGYVALSCAALAGTGLAQTGGSETGGTQTGGTQTGGAQASVQAGELSMSQTSDPYYALGQQTLEQMLATQPNNDEAKNVIIFVADGAGPTTVTATRILAGQIKGMMGEENILPYDTFPNVALTKTYNSNAQVPDSAGTATAWSTGVKTKMGVLGVGPETLRGDCASAQENRLTLLFELAESVGMATGTVSTARITHATPAADYAHSADRDWEDDSELPEGAAELGCTDIAAQLIEFPYGDGLEVAMGGGRRHFLPETADDPEDEGETGNRTDGRNLTEEWTSGREGATYVWNQEQFDVLDPASTGPVLGLFNSSHMQYEADRAEDASGEPSLSEMVSKSIDILSQNDTGYVLQVESGRVDHASHDTNAFRTLTDNIEFGNAVQTALDKVDLSETLIIVTADHAHTMDMAGYPQRGNPILGLVKGLDDQGLPADDYDLAADEKPYTTLGYLNGPGAVIGERPDLTDVDTQAKEFFQQTLIPLGSETHDGTDIATYATGPRSHLVRGTVEQNYLFHVMNYALGNLAERAGVEASAQTDAPNVESGMTDLSNLGDTFASSATGGTETGDSMTGGAMTGGSTTGGMSGGAATAPAGDVTEPSVEETISALEGGVENLDAEVALENIQGWQQRLSSLDDPDLEPLITSLDQFATALRIGSPEAGNILARLGEQTTRVAEGLNGAQAESLKRLGELLSQAAGN